MISTLFDYLQNFRARSIWLIGFLSISMSFFWYLPGVEAAVGEDLPIPANEYAKNSEDHFLVTPSAALAKSANFVSNGGFENGKTGWTGMFEIADDNAFQGRNACKLDSNKNKKADLIYSFIPLRSKTTYSYSMTVRREKGSGNVYVYCHYLGADKAYLMSSQTWTAGKSVPITIRKGEAVGKWMNFSGTIRCDRPDFGGIRLCVLIKGGGDIVYIDEIQINEVGMPDAPPWKLPEAVLFSGKPSKFGMAVEDAVQTGQVFQITTTGAVYRLDTESGILECHQRDESLRLVSTIYFKKPLENLEIERKNPDVCVLRGKTISFGFQGDSLIVIATNNPLHFRVKSSIGAKHFRCTDQHLMAIDDSGGFSVMPYSRQNFNTGGSLMTQTPEATELAGWQASFSVGARDMVGIAVFPPKKFEWKRSFDLRIVITMHPPTPEALKAYSEHANVLSLFTGIYRGTPQERYHAPYAVTNTGKLHETIRQAHKLGMKVIIYRHPMSYLWDGWDIDSAIEDMKDFQTEFGFDGWYFDGLFYDRPWLDSYRFIRILRDEVGDGVIYTHCTRNPPLQSIDLYCPFIDAYSDFLLRGEGQIIKGPCDPYLRYVVGTYRISNAFATLKGDRMLMGQKETLTKKIIKAIVSDKLQISPLKEQLHAMLLFPIPHYYKKDFLCFSNPDIETYIGFYFEKLDQQRQEWEKKNEPLPVRWPPCELSSPD